MTRVVWHDEEREVLRVRWRDGLSASAIALELGPEFTRAKVAMQRFHMGLPSRAGAAGLAAMRANGRAHGGLVGRPAGPPKGAVNWSLFEPLRGSTPRPLEQRMRGECCFPVDGPGGVTLSCCLPVEHGARYCLGHVEILAGRPWPPVEPNESNGGLAGFDERSDVRVLLLRTDALQWPKPARLATRLRTISRRRGKASPTPPPAVSAR